VAGGPSTLLSRSQLGELEFPRQVSGPPVAVVHTTDWSDRDTTVELYDAITSPPTAASAGQLAAAAARAKRSRDCADCPARCQRPLATDIGGRPLCPACRAVVLLRQAQQEAGVEQAAAAGRLTAALRQPGAVVVQVDVTTPEPTPAGTKRASTAARIRAVDAGTGRRLVDVLVSLVGPRAKFRVEGAVPRTEAAPAVHAALIGRPLICWCADEITALRQSVPHREWPHNGYGSTDDGRFCEVRHDSARWRAQLNEHRQLQTSIAPGTPDRLLLHLQRVAAITEGTAARAVATAGRS